ncbi:hypothetical protein CR513_13593, partial [Mucuna pruriens]
MRKRSCEENVASQEGTTSYLLICVFHLYAQLSNLAACFKKMLECFQGIFLEEIPCRLPPIMGIEHRTNFTTGATLPNRNCI